MASRPAVKDPVARQKSRRVAQSADPRAEKSRARVAAAFFALLGRRSYDRIRVSDIARKARIGRATFYAHFGSKDALLRAELTRVVAGMIAEAPGDACLVDCTRLFAHVQQVRAVYRALTGGATRGVTERIVQDAFETRLQSILALRGHGGTTGREFVPRFVASTLLTLVAWSLEQDVAPAPAAIQQMFRGLVGRALA